MESTSRLCDKVWRVGRVSMLDREKKKEGQQKGKKDWLPSRAEAQKKRRSVFTLANVCVSKC